MMKIVIVVVVAVAGCSHTSPSRAVDVTALPRDEYGLQELCPEKSDIRGRAANILRRKRQTQLEALLKASRENPDAKVSVSFTPEDSAELGHETVTVRDLVRQNLQVLRETGCSPAAQRRLQRALAGG